MIEAQNVHYRIGGKTLLEDVSLRLVPGKITAIMGPNGAGKTTLLKCLTGALNPEKGRVFLDNQPIGNYSLQALAKKRAVLSQNTPINFPFTALEIVMMGRSPYANTASSKNDLEIAQKALSAVDVWDLQNRLFPTLSGGEQQRVQLARVLVQLWEQKNACLFLDEPTSALDLKHQHHILQLAQRFAQTHAFTVCMVLHDIALAKRYSDQALLLQNGKILASGDTNTVFTLENLSEAFEVPMEYLTQLKLINKLGAAA